MNIRLTILLVFVLAIFAALALYFRPWDQATPSQDQPWLYRIDDDAIVHVEVTHQGDTKIYDKDLGRGKWYIVDGDERSEVFQRKWAGTPLLLSGPKVNRVLSETIENPAQYGLDPPESIIEVTEETGLVYEFWLGNETPDEGYSYTRLVGDPKLFTVPAIWAEVVNRLVNEPPYIPPPLELGYFYEIFEREIRKLEVTHGGTKVTYEPVPSERTWYVTIGDERRPVSNRIWHRQPTWFAKPEHVGYIVQEGADMPEYGLVPAETTVRVITADEVHEFYIGGEHPETDDNDEVVLDESGEPKVLVRYAGLPDDPVVYAVNAIWADRIIALATDPPAEQ
jgi:hypothetical protein